jgi:hypothetical protein
MVSPGDEVAAEEEMAQIHGEWYLANLRQQHDQRLEDPEYKAGRYHNERSCELYGLRMRHWSTTDFVHMLPRLFLNHNQIEREWKNLDDNMKCSCTR